MRVAFVHGFTQTKESWDRVIDALGAAHQCTAIDAPGHGTNPDGRASLAECGRQIATTAGKCALVGYSMGARMALHAALAHPGQFTKIVLVSGTAGIDDPDERHQRRLSDENLADRIELIGVPAFIDEWLANPMFAGLPADPAQRAQRLANTAKGLADSLRHAGTGTQEPLWERLASIDVPVLVVTGAEDGKFDALGRRMASLIPHADHVSVHGAGHAVHAERPDEFVDLLRRFLA